MMISADGARKGKGVFAKPLLYHWHVSTRHIVAHMDGTTDTQSCICLCLQAAKRVVLDPRQCLLKHLSTSLGVASKRPRWVNHIPPSKRCRRATSGSSW
eukprot:48931-Eustigmatos_ZCMA.PRE.1